MSISAYGRSTFDCVWRCSIGFCSAPRPLIHILAGENVCIHVMTPTHRGSALTSSIWRWIPTDSVSTGWNTTVSGMSPPALSCCTMARRLIGDLAERVVAVQGLAAGEEPDLAVVV